MLRRDPFRRRYERGKLTAEELEDETAPEIELDSTQSPYVFTDEHLPPSAWGPTALSIKRSVTIRAASIGM